MTDSGTYSLVRDDQGKIIGLWLRNQTDTDDRDVMAYLLLKHGADKDVSQRILMGFYEVRPNDVDEQGGFFVLITDHNPRIAKPASTTEFVSLVVGGAVLVECEVSIPQAVSTFDEVGHVLKGFGMETPDAVSFRERCFSTVCVRCGNLLNGAAVGTVNMMRAENDGAPVTKIKQERDLAGHLVTIADLKNGNSLTVKGPGRAIRFYMGKCSNESCESERVIMRWIDIPKEQHLPNNSVQATQ